MSLQDTNQSGLLPDLDLFSSDRALVEVINRAGFDQASAAGSSLRHVGRTLGQQSSFERGRIANLHTPVLLRFDRFGERRDEVEFHPAWHESMAWLVGEGLHCAGWQRNDPPDSHLIRAAKYLMVAQVENGSQCPVTMTWAAVPLLARQAQLVDDWLPKLMSRTYDAVPGPLAQRNGALVGMGMTERQGGSDVRTNATRAHSVPASEFGDAWGRPYRLQGHKWFMSAPMCDGFLVLAQADEGLSCFLVPRYLPDGRRNRLLLQRLKDKLGNRSNASAEVEFDETAAFLVGEPGRGLRTILDVAALTRFDCAVASAGIMRRALVEALHHASRRAAFGKLLVDQPLMTNVLADLALESEASMRWSLRLATLLDRRDADADAAALFRIGTPLAKYWICRRGPAFAFEAMEVLGGNGYVEEAPIARLYRELPVNSIWEGSGNVMCLDVLRALQREPACRRALEAELGGAMGFDARYDRFVSRLLESLSGDQSQARRLVGDLARAWQAALMLRGAPAEIGAFFCAARLDERRAAGDQAYGTLGTDVDYPALVKRAMPSTDSS